MRYSKQRNAILSYIKSVKTHPTAEDIQSAVREFIPDISLGTVYRNLDVLEKMGEIIKIESRFGKVNYDGDTRPHQHFFCNKCRKIYDLNLSSCVQECEKLGYKVTRECTVFYGICVACGGEK